MENDEKLPKVNEDIISSVTPAGDIVSALAKRGCVDLTSSINLAACGDHALAGGGFCDVYQGELYDGTKIAIKSLRIFGPDAESQRKKILKRAAKELYHWSRLRHRNVLPLMGLAFFRGHISMISEWMDNGNLTSFLRLNVDASRICFCIDVCAGLCYIHENGMVHGDLKAANVVISSHGIAMITDFGNAQLKDITLQFTNTTAHEISVRWAAPELLEGRQASKEADVYAYGMTALEVLSGKIPYEGLSDIHVITQVAVKKEHPPRPKSGLDDDLWGILVRCWAWSPNERPSIASVNDHLRALHPDCISHSQQPGSPLLVYGAQDSENGQFAVRGRLGGQPIPATPSQPIGSPSETVVSSESAPDASTHTSFLLSGPKFPTERHTLDSQPLSAGSSNAGNPSSLHLAQEQPEAHFSSAALVPALTAPHCDPAPRLFHNLGGVASDSVENIESNAPGFPTSTLQPEPPDVAVGVGGVRKATKRAAEPDEGPRKALKPNPPHEIRKSGSSSSSYSSALPSVTPSMIMNDVTSMASAPASVPSAPDSVVMRPLPPLMHAHTFSEGFHASYPSLSPATMSHGNMGVAEGTLPSSEPTPPLMAQTQGRRLCPSSHLTRSNDSDEVQRHLEQEDVAILRQTPPKARMDTRSGNSTPSTSSTSLSHSANVLEPELKSEVDRVFFKFLNRICSNSKATDSKGSAIHQTRMAAERARLRGWTDFRPIRFRVKAFTNGFLEELTNEGYPNDVIPTKKVCLHIKSYLRKQPYISRFNEDGKKVNSWIIGARKLDDDGSMQWGFREFKRRVAGNPPSIAYRGHLWQWAPHVWDPHVPRTNITATFSSPSLPPWLSWSDNVLSGIPGPDAVDTDITVTTKLRASGDTDEDVLSHTFQLTIASSPVDPTLAKSRKPPLARDFRRSVSDSAIWMRTGSTSSDPSDNQVMEVLAAAVSRVTHAAHAAQTGATSTNEDRVSLAKQRQVLGMTVQAVADKIRAGDNPDSQGTTSELFTVARSVVVGAAQLVLTDRVAQRNAGDPTAFVPAQAPMSITEVSAAVQSAVADVVTLDGLTATEVEVMMATKMLIDQKQLVATTTALQATQATSYLLNGIASRSASPLMSQAGSHRSRSISVSSSSGPSIMPWNYGFSSRSARASSSPGPSMDFGLGSRSTRASSSPGPSMVSTGSDPAPWSYPASSSPGPSMMPMGSDLDWDWMLSTPPEIPE